MSGGIAYVLDTRHDLYMRLNKEQVRSETITDYRDRDELRELIEEHVAATGSPRGKEILENFDAYVPGFKKIVPRGYDRMLKAIESFEEQGMPASRRSWKPSRCAPSIRGERKMGKPTGFLEYDRADEPCRRRWSACGTGTNSTLRFPTSVREQQGARCMNCGVPFCQAGLLINGKAFGCPLHNLIPEWNDMIMMGNKAHALARLLKTNNFPEFTGRVCPAPCEKACNCGKYEGPVTIKAGELSVIEDAWAEGRMVPRHPPQYSGKKVCVVGSGPAGLAAADQLNRRGHSITVIEREERPGGPADLRHTEHEAAQGRGAPAHRDNDRRGRDLRHRRGRRRQSHGGAAYPGIRRGDPVLRQQKAQGSGLRHRGVSGVYFGVDFLKASVERFQFGKDPAVPAAGGRDVVVIGTGDTAADCVGSAIRQGCASVTQLVRRKREDYPAVMPSDYAHEEAQALFGHDPRRYGVQVKSLVTDGGRLTGVVTTDGDTLPCTLLIGATGFAGCRGGCLRRLRGGHGQDRGHVAGQLSDQRGKGLRRRRYAPGPVPGGVGHRRGPRRRRPGGRVSHRLHQSGVKK
jgi:glutamate synthase (NADPH/NADH) small chain